MRITRIRQHDETDCGAACLFSIAAHHGRRVPIARIRQLAGTDRGGTSIFGIVRAAQRLGFVARGVKGSLDSLRSVPLPAIAHVQLENRLHYVAVYRLRRSAVVVMDPYDGRVHRLAMAEFARQWTGVLVLLAPGDEFRPGRETQSRGRRFWALVRPHGRLMLQAFVGALVYTALGLATAVFVQKLIDDVLPSGNTGLLHLLGLGMVVVVLAQVFIGAVRGFLTLRTGQMIDAALITGYYRHVLRLPQRFFDGMRVGELVSRFNDAIRIRAFINDVALALVVDLLVVGFSLGVMFLYSVRLALVTGGFLLLFGLLYAVVNRANRGVSRRLMQSAAEVEAELVATLTAVGTVKRFALEDLSGWRAETRFVRLLRAVYGSGRNAIVAGSASELVSRMAVVTILWVGAGLVLTGGLSAGELMSSYALLGYLATPAARLVGANQAVQEALVAADRLFEISDLEVEEEPRLGGHRAPAGDLTFEGVTFAYGPGPPVLSDVSFTIPEGQVTAVVGESGSGKSTLAALMQRVHSPDAGCVRIGGVDLRCVRTEILRRRVAVVPQEIHLFPGTLLENIVLDDSEPDLARVAAICAELGLNPVVDRLPAGYDTRVGEHGANLAGGERQRVAIARALYREPRILVLDEAASALDPLAERKLQAVIARSRERGGTVVLIAHRLASAAGADRILVMSAGRVVEEGSHSELLARGGAYHTLWQAQRSGWDEKPAAAPGWIRSI